MGVVGARMGVAVDGDGDGDGGAASVSSTAVAVEVEVEVAVAGSPPASVSSPPSGELGDAGLDVGEVDMAELPRGDDFLPIYHDIRDGAR